MSNSAPVAGWFSVLLVRVSALLRRSTIRALNFLDQFGVVARDDFTFGVRGKQHAGEGRQGERKKEKPK